MTKPEGQQRPFFNITPGARAIAGSSPVSEDEVSEVSQRGLLRERFALEAVLISRCIDRAFASTFDEVRQNPPFDYPFVNEVGDYIHDQLRRSIDEELGELGKRNTEDPLRKLFDRYSQITGGSGIDHPSEPLHAGAETATTVMSRTMTLVNLLPLVHSEFPSDRQTIRQTALNSFPLISKLASLHIRDFDHMMRFLGDPKLHEMDPRHFIVEKLPNDKGYRVDFRPDLLEVQTEISWVTQSPIMAVMRPERLRCPALVTFDSQSASAIKKLWDLFVDLSTGEPVVANQP